MVKLPVEAYNDADFLWTSQRRSFSLILSLSFTREEK